MRRENPKCPNCNMELYTIKKKDFPYGADAYVCRKCGEMFMNYEAKRYYGRHLSVNGKRVIMTSSGIPIRRCSHAV